MDQLLEMKAFYFKFFSPNRSKWYRFRSCHVSQYVCWNGIRHLLCKSLKQLLISLYFASKEPDILVMSSSDLEQ